MKEYCLIPKSTAEQFLLKSSTGSRIIKRNRKTDEEKKEKSAETVVGFDGQGVNCIKKYKETRAARCINPKQPPAIYGGHRSSHDVPHKYYRFETGHR